MTSKGWLMALYRIVHYDKDGIPAEELTVDFSEDDEAIEHVGWIDRPHEVCLWQEDRLVLRCPPWTAVVPSGGMPSTPAEDVGRVTATH